VRADRAIFKHCRFLGHQDTLFADYGRQYYVDSYIEGGVDFIFGNAAAVFDRSEFHANGPGYLTAQSRTSADQPTGYVIVNSRVTVDPPARPVCVSCGGMAPPGPLAASDSGKPPKEALSVLVPIRPSLSLGRPWRPYSRVIVMHTELPADLNPAGWSLWKPTDPLPPPAYYAEFENSGPGASLSARVSWSHRLTPAQAKQYLPASFLGGPKAGPSHWDPLAEAARLP
jgi:pectinesterase